MKPTANTKIIDLHCDTIWECWKREIGLENPELGFSLHKLEEPVRLCQAMAVYISDDLRGEAAENQFLQVAGYFARQLEEYRGRVAQVRELNAIDQTLEDSQFGLILTLEGGAALAGNLKNLDRFYDLGLRMMNLTYNECNEIAGGVNTDEGFTSFGRDVVRRMEELGVVVDISHLSDRGVYELCDLARRPFLASHSNARAVCGHPRNLNDDLFRRVMEHGGVVGLNYHRMFIVEEQASRSVDDLLRHVHHFLELGGENTLCLGSDMDGADMPDYINSLEKHLTFLNAVEKSGVPSEVVEKIAYGNARRFFKDYANGGTQQ